MTQPKRLADLAGAAGELALRVDDPGTLVHGLAYDGPVRHGDLFFCVAGSIDGHAFADAAAREGAVAVCAERPTNARLPELIVSDSRRAMARIAAAFFGYPSQSLVLVGVTGTDGKTSTTFLVDAIMRAVGRRTGLIGTLGAWLDGEPRDHVRTHPVTPPTLHGVFADMVAVGIDTVTLEVTSHGLALDRLEGLRFASAAFTNISRDHLDFHGTLDEYFDAKRSLFTPERLDRAAVNFDDQRGRAIAAHAEVECVGFGRAPDAHIRAEDVQLGTTGTSFRLLADGPGVAAGEVTVTMQLTGSFNVSNALAAAALALQTGVTLDAVQAGLATAKPVPGRLEPVSAGQPFAVLVDYAHGPASLEALLQEGRRRAGRGRVICVFGCGGGGDPGKRPLMGAVAARLADRVILTTDNPRDEDPRAIIEEIRAGANGAQVLADRARAIRRAINLAGDRDVVVIAGKGHEQTQEFRDETVPFDDRAVVCDALAALGWRP